MAEVLAAAPTTPATTPAAPAAPAVAAQAAPAATPASPPPQVQPAVTTAPAAPVTPAKTEAAPSTAPEKYSAFTVPKGLPEGHALAEPVVQSVEKVARTLGLSQERAQTLVDEVMPSVYRHGQAQLDAMVKGWETELQNHKTLGGDKLPEARADVKFAIEKLGSPELVAFLESPFKPGQQPAVFEFLHKVAQLLKQDGFVASRRGPSSGADPSTDDAALADRLYPKSRQAAAS